jgi:hypothetical protein
MDRPTLTLALSTVLAARVEGERRSGLLAVIRPDFQRSGPRSRGPVTHDGTVVPLPRVIPMPTRPRDDDGPDAA